MKLEDIDLLDYGLYRSERAHEAWKTLRQRAPVHWNPGRHSPGFWAITRHEDVYNVLRDPSRFSSAGGTIIDLPAGYQPPQGVVSLVDPPAHSRLRHIVARVFSPRLVASLEEYARAFVIELVEAAVAKRQFDFVTEIAYPLSLIAFCELLGIPDEDREHLGRISEKHFFLDRKLRKDFREFQRARKAEQLGYLIDLIDARRRDPRDDLITRVVAANDADELTDEQAVRFLDLLVDAGKDTTRYAIIGGQLALIQHPDQRERLLADRSLAARATEEILRWTTPINHDARTLTEDVTLRGVTMKRGDRAVVFYASANRDEAAFPDPERLDLGRDPNPHVTFGAGPHICLGKALTRLEIRLFIEEVAPRLAGAELVAPPRRIRTPFISGYETLPLALP